MPEFAKGQLVAVKEPPDTHWSLRVFERYVYTGETYCVEVMVRRPESESGYCVCLQSVRPAEEVWPNIFLRRDHGHDNYLEELCLEKCKSARLACVVEKLRRRIRRMCRLNAKFNDEELRADPTSYCPPEKRKSDEPCVEDCADCWEQAILKDVEGGYGAE